MKIRSVLLLACLAALVPAVRGAEVHDSGLMTYERFLEIRSLDPDDLECVAETTEAVLNTRLESWEHRRTVCEVWIKEKVIPRRVIPAERLRYLDGTPVYRTTREWTEEVPVEKTRTVERRGTFMVKEDEEVEKKEEVTSFKRYVVEEQR